MSGYTHELKTWPMYFRPLMSGEKAFEFRADDRTPRFEVGDRLRLREWGGATMDYSGRDCWREVTYVARGGVIRPEHLILSMATNGHDTPFHSLEAAERDHISRVFAATGRQKTRTAEILGVSRPRLDRLLLKHGLA